MGNRNKFKSIQVPRQCPFVLLVKVVEKKVTRPEMEKAERRKVDHRQKLTGVQMHSTRTPNPDINLGSAAFSEMLMLK
jgi:hypothetical protein